MWSFSPNLLWSYQKLADNLQNTGKKKLNTIANIDILLKVICVFHGRVHLFNQANAASKRKVLATHSTVHTNICNSVPPPHGRTAKKQRSPGHTTKV
jgi:hypothetical protein